jgi:hypothetical protein
LTDGLRDDDTARLPPCGPWRPPERRHAQGPRPKPRGLPLPQLLSAQGGKTVRRRRLRRVRHRGGCGTLEALPQGLAACGGQSHPACVERLPRTRRPPVAAVGRRGSTRGPGEASLRQQRVVYQVSSHFCRPPARLRQPLPPPGPTHGPGAAQPWRPGPPVMAAGLPDRGWTRREGLLARGPPWPQPQELEAAEQEGDGAGRRAGVPPGRARGRHQAWGTRCERS